MLKCVSVSFKSGVKQFFNSSIKKRPALHNLKYSFSNQQLKFFHTSLWKNARIFVDNENVHAYKIIQTIPIASIEGETSSTLISCEVDSENELNELLQQNWRGTSASDVLDGFKNAVNYCVLNNIALSDTRFDNLVDGLMDHVECLTDEELAELLSIIARYPPAESFKSHNFHDIWSCLDDVCCWRISNWNTDTILQFCNHWYKLNLGRVSDFIYEALNKFSRRPERLTKDQLVHVFFYINVCRKRGIDFGFESALDSLIETLTVDEMAVCAMGFFKSQSKVKISRILEAMIKKIKDESDSVHEMSLCPILKIIKYSNFVALAVPIKQLLEALIPQVDRLSNLACVHIALLGTNIAVCHNEILEKITEKLVKNMGNTELVRLKDIERLLLSLTMFNLHPKTSPDFFEEAYKELHSDERLKEIIQYPRTLISSLMHLSMKNMYSHELMHTVLDQDYIVDTFGKPAKLLPRELFILDKCIELECPNYAGNRLDIKTRYRAAKWLTEFAPSHDQYKKLTAADKLFLDVVDHLKQISGNDKHVYVQHVLPHFPRADIILCQDMKTNQFIEPCGFDNYILGDIMYPHSTKDLRWFAVVVVGWNNTIRDTSLPVGMVTFKSRHLKHIGYKPVLIFWNEYMRLLRNDKLKYIQDKMKE